MGGAICFRVGGGGGGGGGLKNRLEWGVRLCSAELWVGVWFSTLINYGPLLYQSILVLWVGEINLYSI